jgi:hypothetical protein
MAEIIGLKYAKFSCSLFLLDSHFPHVMILCTIQGSPKLHHFLYDFLFLKILMREIFVYDDQIDQLAS